MIVIDGSNYSIKIQLSLYTKLNSKSKDRNYKAFVQLDTQSPWKFERKHKSRIFLSNKSFSTRLKRTWKIKSWKIYRVQRNDTNLRYEPFFEMFKLILASAQLYIWKVKSRVYEKFIKPGIIPQKQEASRVENI